MDVPTTDGKTNSSPDRGQQMTLEDIMDILVGSRHSTAMDLYCRSLSILYIAVGWPLPFYP